MSDDKHLYELRRMRPSTHNCDDASQRNLHESCKRLTLVKTLVLLAQLVTSPYTASRFARNGDTIITVKGEILQMTPQTELVLKQIVKGDKSIDPNNAIRAFALLRNPSSHTAEPKPILRIPTVAQLLGISKATVYEYLEKGLLKRIYGEGVNAFGVDQDSYIAFTNRSQGKSASK